MHHRTLKETRSRAAARRRAERVTPAPHSAGRADTSTSRASTNSLARAVPDTAILPRSCTRARPPRPARARPRPRKARRPARSRGWS
eukprot:2916827-Rhodomonas_salina.1